MKLIIDIDEETLKGVNCCGLFLNPRDKENLVNSIKHSTPIPDNTTNGDVIKTIIPMEDYYGRRAKDFYHFIGWNFPEWWNSPYKRGETDE